MTAQVHNLNNFAGEKNTTYRNPRVDVFLPRFKLVQQQTVWSCDDSLFTPPKNFMRLCPGQAFCLPPVCTLIFFLPLPFFFPLAVPIP